MDFNNDLGIIDTVLVLDTTETPAKGGNVNSLIILGTGALGLPTGTTAQEPSGANVQAGMIRWNTDQPQLEYYNGTVWRSFTAGTGSVTSVAASGGTTGLSFSGGPITTSGTLTLSGTLGATNGGTGLSTAPSANGQLLIGSSTGTYTLATLTAGTGVSVTNAAGSITIANAGVTSFQTSLSGLTPSTSTTGAVTLAGTLGVTSGGTGNSAAPTSGQVPIGNSSGSFSYATITGGTAIGVSNGSGSVTINNTGVTSIAGTANQITASAATGAVTLSLPSTVIVSNLDVSSLTPNGNIYVGAAGAVVSTAAMTNGQLLIGSTSAAPVLGTITAGGGISVTNGAGTITVANTGVTSFSAGSTGFTPSVSTSGAVVLAGSLNPASGGTGLTSTPTAGQLAIGNSSSGYTLGTLTAGTGIGIVNASGSITINNTGVTSVAAATTSTGLSISGSPITTTGTLTFTLSSALQALATLGAGATTGLVTQSGVNTFSDVTITGTAGDITVANGNGIGGNPTIDLATVTQGTGSSFVKVTLDTKGRVTGNTAVAQSDLTSILGTFYLPEAGGTMTGAINMGANQINNLGMATIPAGTDAVNVNYVQAQLAGLSWKQEVTAATTANITLSGTQTVDGVALTSGQRVLVKNQTDQTTNGIYIVASGAWTRSTDTSTGAELQGAAVYVDQGTVNANTGWTQTTAGTITIGTSNIVWSQFSGSGSYAAGTGLTLTGNTFALSTPVAVTNGGTGETTAPTSGQLMIGTSSGGYAVAGLTAGAGVSVTNGSGTITLANTGVTSITGTANQITASASTGGVTLSLPSTVIVSNLDVSTLTQNGILYSGAGGAVTSTAAPTNGQLLIGYTGQNPVLSTLTAGTGVSVTNSTGSITIANTGVTSFSAGSTGFTPSVSSTGAVTLAGSLNPAIGGTGLSSAPTAGQIAVGTTGGGFALTTITAGTGISVTNGSGSISIANTGVTSVAMTVPSILSVSGSPITTTGTLAVTLATQTGNSIFAGPTAAGSGVPTFRALVAADVIGTALKLYNENASGVTQPVVTGTNAVAIGNGSSATMNNAFALGPNTVASGINSFALGVFSTAAATNSLAIGANSNAYLPGGINGASGDFSSIGDAQFGKYVLRNITTNATQTQLYMDGASQLLVLPNNSMWTFDILIAARRTDTTGTAGSWRFVGGIKKDTTAASTTLVGLTSETVIGVVGSALTVTVIADTANGSLDVEVTGVAGNTVRWVAVVNTVEIHQ